MPVAKQQLNVALNERSYTIEIGAGLLADSELLRSKITGDQVFIVSNETIAPLYLQAVVDAIGSEKEVSQIILPDGEQYKNLTSMQKIYDALLAARCNRDVTLVALGGGVVGDMTGFAAATYQRGVNFVQIPTTMLAQVDSSVGGKTGVNHASGKNMIGAFYQPVAVLIDTDTLATLPNRELRAGLAEVIKYGLIRDAEFLEWLQANMKKLLARDTAAMQYAIARSCQNKADIVAADEREKGLRATLNLGHTFGHAIETATKYKTWLHGEAVGMGMLMAMEFSRRCGHLSEAEVDQGASLISAAGLPNRLPSNMPDAENMLALMALDKKVMAGKIRLVLLRALGEACVTADFSMPLLKDMLADYLAQAS
jgi:3-dehydroquinate synthase